MPSGAHSGAIGRAVRLSDRVLTVVAIPDGIDRPSRFRHILGERWKRTNVLVVTEGGFAASPTWTAPPRFPTVPVIPFRSARVSFSCST